MTALTTASYSLQCKLHACCAPAAHPATCHFQAKRHLYHSHDCVIVNVQVTAASDKLGTVDHAQWALPVMLPTTPTDVEELLEIAAVRTILSNDALLPGTWAMTSALRTKANKKGAQQTAAAIETVKFAIHCVRDTMVWGLKSDQQQSCNFWLDSLPADDPAAALRSTKILNNRLSTYAAALLAICCSQQCCTSIRKAACIACLKQVSACACAHLRTVDTVLLTLTVMLGQGCWHILQGPHQHQRADCTPSAWRLHSLCTEPERCVQAVGGCCRRDQRQGAQSAQRWRSREVFA